MKGRVDDRFISSALRDVLNASVEQMRYIGASSRRSRVLTELVHTFSRTSLNLPKLGSSILQAFSIEEFAEPLYSLIQYSLPSVPLGTCQDLDVCPVAATEARRELCLSLCSLILQVIIQGTAEETRIEFSLSLKLLGKQREYAVPSAPCSFRSQISNAMMWEKTPFLEQISTPDDPSVSHNWGERLASKLLRDAKYKHETIVRMVGEICRDLEDRCATVEIPLREEQTRAMKLREVLHAAQCEISRLESEAQDHRLLMNNMDVDKAHLEDEMKLLKTKVQDATEETQQLQQQLQVLSRDAETAMSAANERAEQRELEHLAILNVKEENIEDLHAKIDELERSLHDVRGGLERKTEEYNEARQKVDMLENQMQSKTEEIELQGARIVEQGERIRVLHDLEQSLRKQVEVTNKEVGLSYSHNLVEDADIEADSCESQPKRLKLSVSSSPIRRSL